MGTEDVNVPPELADILKNFAKAAILTQPDDLVVFGMEYFEAQKKGDSSFGSERADIEEGTRDLTMELLWSIHRQFHTIGFDEIKKEDLLVKWKYLRLDRATLDEILKMVMIEEDENEFKYGLFLLGSCGYLTKDFNDTIKGVCKLLTPNREDGHSRIPCELFIDMLTFMLTMIFDAFDDEDKKKEVEEWINKPIGWLKETFKGGYEGSGMIGPDEFTHEDCPPLFPKKWVDDE